MKNDNLTFLKNKKVLITGHTGFKGSWLAVILYYFGAKIYGISREKKEGIYEMAKISELMNSEYFIDISEKSINSLSKIVNEINPDIVFHFAAQSLVIKSYNEPKDTIYSNIIGTYNMLEVINNSPSVKSLIISTTDKVYKNPENNNIESSDLGSSDYYSASKVSSELIIDSFINITMRDSLNISVVRSGNVIGGGDRSENRLITDIVNKLINNEDIVIRMPKSVRPWQYILDSLSGYLKVSEENFKQSISETYNLNSSQNNKINVKEIAELMIKGWGSDSKLIVEKKLKYSEVNNLNIDSSKAKENLSWEAKLEMDEIITKIIKWEQHHQSNNSFEYCLDEVHQYFEI